MAKRVELPKGREANRRDKTHPQPERFRELWCRTAPGQWRCAGRMAEPAPLLSGVFEQGVVPMVLLKISEAEGSGEALGLWRNFDEPDAVKETVLRVIFEGRDCDVLRVEVPPHEH